MGRALFSQTYAAPAPAVRTEPEPNINVCEKWSAWNRFDPDSEDFFQDAEYEAFVDPVRLAREQAAALTAAEGSTDSSDSSDSSDSDQGSPMAVGSDDPAVLIAGYADGTVPWDLESEMARLADIEWRSTTTDRTTGPITFASGPMPQVFTLRSPPNSEVGNPVDVFIPPASFREPTPDIQSDRNRPIVAPRSPTLRRTVNITPIGVSRIRDPSSPSRSASPDFLAAPSTPPTAYRQQVQTMVSPSPPSSVTPRFYSWQHHPIPTLPSSPTFVHGTRDGPLTNPRARMSFARIESSPARVM